MGNLRSISMLLAGLALGCSLRAAAEPLLPDLIVETDELEIHSIDTGELPGRTLLRFQSSLPNIGPGEFILVSNGIEVSPGLEQVEQEVRQTEGAAVRHLLDGFHYNVSTIHMDVFDWVAYRIREILPGDGVGEILRTGQKPSVRLTSSRTYDSSLPNYVGVSQRMTATVRRMGISVGWTDIYTPSLDLQWVDVTGLQKGEYWLEVEVDFGGYVDEANEDNNIGRIKVTLDNASLPDFPTHRADTGNFGVFDLTELLRVIQLYNSGGFECAENTEDGFLPGGADTGCQPHSSDYAPADWKLSLSELLRTIQLFNVGGYVPCLEGEDGFCPASR